MDCAQVCVGYNSSSQMTASLAFISTESMSKFDCMSKSLSSDTYQTFSPRANHADLSGQLILDYWLFPVSELNMVKLPWASVLPLLLMNLLLNHISFVLLFFILCALVACIVFIISFSCFCLCDLHFRVAVGYETCRINQFAMPKYE